MKNFKTIIAGAIIGAAVFFIPFVILRIFLFVLIITAVFRFFSKGRWGRGFDNRLHFANKIRSMSQEEYSRFKQGFQRHRGFSSHTGTVDISIK